jgi:hypothetical protein
MTPLAQCLRSDTPDSIRNCARLYGMTVLWRSWEELEHSVRTGETGLSKAFGVADGFAYLAPHPEQAAVFDGAMTDYTRTNAPAIAEAYHFARFRKIVDVAGGHGNAGNARRAGTDRG